MTCRIVAELSCNHLGSLERALELVDACATAGADAVKIQAWAPGKMVLDKSYVLREGPWVGTNLYELYEQAQTPPAWIGPIFQRAAERGIEAFASVFDRESLETLEVMGCPRYKVASFEIVDLPLVDALARTKKPLILSTGMATEVELDRAVDTLHQARAERRLALMHCVSGYPVENQDANLRRMDWLRRYAVPVGYSGHEKGTAISVAAVARGASLIERHLTLDRTMPGPDHAASLEPKGFTQLVRDIRKIEAALGPQIEQPMPCEMASKRKLRKCAVAADDITAGTVLGNWHVKYKSPEVEGGISADRQIWGKKVTRDIAQDEPILLADLT